MSHPDFNYGSITATLAWTACELTGAACGTLDVEGILGNFSVSGIFDANELQQDLTTKARGYRLFEEQGDSDTLRAQRICVVVGLVVTLPYILVMIVLVYVLQALVQLPFSVVNIGVQFVMQILFYSHIDASANI